MKLSWTYLAWEDYIYWQTNDKKTLKRINTLIKSIQRTPFEGIGKPEHLRFDLAGKWSRRISEQHRLVYEVKTNSMIIYQCRYHY
mgnify:CR=1 FL=1